MGLNKTYAVFGLGRYGTAVASELVRSGAEVLAVDINENIVNNAALTIPFCKCADITDAEVIKQLGISNIDVVIIAMAASFEASVLAITLCKEAGVKTVIVKCATEMQRNIYYKVGADKVVYPEKDSGVRLAKNLVSAGFVDMVELASNVSLVELDVLPEWLGKSLIELDFRRKYSINVVAIRTGEEICLNIAPDKPLEDGMKLVVIANIDKLNKLIK